MALLECSLQSPYCKNKYIKKHCTLLLLGTVLQVCTSSAALLDSARHSYTPLTQMLSLDLVFDKNRCKRTDVCSSGSNYTLTPFCSHWLFVFNILEERILLSLGCDSSSRDAFPHVQRLCHLAPSARFWPSPPPNLHTANSKKPSIPVMQD